MPKLEVEKSAARCVCSPRGRMHGEHYGNICVYVAISVLFGIQGAQGGAAGRQDIYIRPSFL